MTLIGLDLNATRARAIHGSSSQLPSALPLVGSQRDLPVAISLEERQPLVGWAGAALVRKLPHLACVDFLPWLGDSRTWSAGRHRLDAARALALVFEHLTRVKGRAQGTLAVPAYLRRDQVALVGQIADRARWHILGLTLTPLAATLSAPEELPCAGLAVVVDVDGHALTWSAVQVYDGQARLFHTHASVALNRTIWLIRLLNTAALRCIRLSRRDPRESADGEQDLYDQLSALLDTHSDSTPVDLTVQTPHWYQRLRFEAGELAGACAPLVKQAVAETSTVLAGLTGSQAVGALLLTDAAARLPGLAAALEEMLAAQAHPTPSDETDFGEDLLRETHLLTTRLRVLDADAVARSAHELATRIQRGDLPRGHLDSIPLPSGDGPVDGGPPRLHFRGQDHVLSGETFTLGRDPSCNLVLESEQYPTVSARHCEIVFDQRVYFLRDRSRHGTFVNDCLVTQQVILHSGDWIRLGPSGPVLRFLGDASNQPRLMPTA